MMYMQDGIVMNTTLDPNAQGGGLDRQAVLGRKARAVRQHVLRHDVRQRRRTSDRTSRSRRTFPGKIRPVDLREWNGTLIAQKDCFLCAARGINVTIAFTRRIGAGFFGGEGFILQRIEGDGLAFLHASGALARDRPRAG